MKLEVADIEVHSRGLGEKYRYSVAQNAKIMKMLADGVYSDKVLAPVRELSTNANDGHIRAGTTSEPFDVYLPTPTNLEFRIRDYGCGMDRKQLTKLYTTYGDSDKNNSNDYNGCMGIGSKSPFAYCDAFTTTSFKDGKKYVCVNAKDKDGIPSLEFMLDGVDTSEANGIEITFAVRHEDCNKFQVAAEKLYRHFPVKPNIVRGSCNFKPLDYLYEGKGWRIFRNSEASVAVMGWIAYPVDHTHFSKYDDSNTYSHYYRNRADTPEAELLQMGIEMDFDIGDIEMDIAREALQYNSKTNDAIKDKLADVLAFLKAEMSKSFDTCASLWEARIRFQDLRKGKMQRLEKLCNLQSPQFNGKDIEEYISLDKIPGVSIVKFSNENLATPKRYDRVERFYFPDSTSKDKILFYENDVERGAYAGCQRVIKQSTARIDDLYLIKFQDAAAKTRFAKLLGWKDTSLLRKASDCPKPCPKTRKKRENVFSFELDKATVHHHSNRWAKDWWTTSEVDFDDGGVFVEINSFKCIKKGNRQDSSASVGRMIKLLGALGVKEPKELVGIKTAVVKRYRKSNKWEDVFDWIERKFKEYLKNNNVGETLANILCIQKFQNEDKYAPLFKSPVSQKIDLSDSVLGEFWKKIEELKLVQNTYQEKCEHASELAKALEVDLKGHAKYDLRKEEEKVEARYEILTILDSWDISRADHPMKVARYIQFVDDCKGE